MTGPLGIEHQTALGLPPVELVALAAKLGCPYLGIVLSTDLARSIEGFAWVAETAAARGKSCA